MKIVTYYLGKNIIEVHNSTWGKETISLNGNMVSEKFSILGAEHRFQIVENGESKEVLVKPRYDFPRGLQIDLMVDNKPFIEHAKSMNLFWGIFIIVLGFILVINIFSKHI